MLEAVGEVFPETKYQWCTVHFYRNVFSGAASLKSEAASQDAQSNPRPGELESSS